ncbi:1,6-anhydro-N-acetylmuramyl-L-alanine amidase AmpD [Saccharophagus sp. K07]|uniref:1,6-anhydro-N-acetylmuramyl-L-alanine amidase AmpD n=1 Tax=Saccharophagus sp. K07 TaxID=2283636 RepID=UPI00351C869E
MAQRQIDSNPQLSIDSSGWLEGVVRCPSPNFNARPAGEISLLVVHNISLPPGNFGGGYIQRFFCNSLPVADHAYFESIAHLQVSAHCLIDRAGQITQFVSFADRAWHAGVSNFVGRSNCNDFSIGIELEGTDEQPYEELQYRTLAALTQALMARYPAITRQRIVGHSDIAPERKTDPGPAFDWAHYFRVLDGHNS